MEAEESYIRARVWRELAPERCQLICRAAPGNSDRVGTSCIYASSKQLVRFYI
jgi:hypothetical protein